MLGGEEPGRQIDPERFVPAVERNARGRTLLAEGAGVVECDIKAPVALLRMLPSSLANASSLTSPVSARALPRRRLKILADYSRARKKHFHVAAGNFRSELQVYSDVSPSLRPTSELRNDHGGHNIYEHFTIHQLKIDRRHWRARLRNRGWRYSFRPKARYR